MRALIIAAALAAATSAWAANVSGDEIRPEISDAELRSILHTCWTGGYGSGFRGYGSRDAQWAGIGFGSCLSAHNNALHPFESWRVISVIETCAAKDEPYCVDMLAHIRQGGGVR